MGTRNITSVIMDGKQVVCQYGQWDGYPTWTGAIIAGFLRNAAHWRLHRALANTTITVTDYENAVSYTGSTKDYSHLSEKIYEERKRLYEKIEKWPEFTELYQYLKEQGEIPEDDLENYFVWTRDTGCNVLSLIYNRPLDKPPLELAAMNHEYNGDYAWDIQGVYVINLDTNKLHMTFDGYSLEFDIDRLPNDIDKAMQIYEDTVYQMYEREKALDFTLFASEVSDANHSGPAWDLTKELAAALSAQLQEENPELFEGLDGKPYITEEDQELIYTILLNKAEQQLEAAKTAEEVSVDAKIESAETRATDTVLKIDGMSMANNEPDR